MRVIMVLGFILAIQTGFSRHKPESTFKFVDSIPYQLKLEVTGYDDLVKMEFEPDSLIMKPYGYVIFKREPDAYAYIEFGSQTINCVKIWTIPDYWNQFGIYSKMSFENLQEEFIAREVAYRKENYKYERCLKVIHRGMEFTFAFPKEAFITSGLHQNAINELSEVCVRPSNYRSSRRGYSGIAIF